MKSLVLLFAMICLSMICQAQKSNTRSLNCSSALTADPVTEVQEITHYIFTGADTSGLNVKLKTITIVEGKRQLVRKRISKDCTSPNPNDCYKEVMEEIPPVTMNLYTLADPALTREHEIRKEKVTVVKNPGGQVTVNVVCPKNRTKKLIRKVQEALIIKGYPLKADGNLDQSTTLALTDFQKTTGLAYGDLTLESLSALGIR